MPPHPVPKNRTGSIANCKHFQFNLTLRSIDSVKMMATPNSAGSSAPDGTPPVRGGVAAIVHRLTLMAGFLTLSVAALFAEPPTASAPLTNSPAYFTALAERAYQTARGRWLADTNRAEAAWQFGRACFDRAEFAVSDAQRAALGSEGASVCRPLVARPPKLAAAHYYLAMNLGQVARTKSVGALPIVSEMELLFKTAAGLEAGFDFAGSDRCLGLLYRDAPVWPASIGNRVKARQHLTHAAELAPQFPENHLNLLETFLQWNEPNNARREWKALADCLPFARTNFTGPAWAANWADWDQRRAAVEPRLRETPRPSR